MDDAGTAWSEEELGAFLTNVGFMQLVVVAASMSVVGWPLVKDVARHPFFSWAFAAPPK
jgi:hypothetical protein